MFTLNVFSSISFTKTSLNLSFVLFAISCMSIFPWGDKSSSDDWLTSNSHRFRLSITLLHRSPSAKSDRIVFLLYKILSLKKFEKPTSAFFVVPDHSVSELVQLTNSQRLVGIRITCAVSDKHPYKRWTTVWIRTYS